MKLHLGCGSRYIPGFVHIDAIKYRHVDIVSSVDKLPLVDNSADLIYASHVLEHFGRFEYINVLKEWYRLLKPGGELRLAVPDFSACVNIYISGGFGDDISSSALIGLICGGQRNIYDFHKMIFDELSLSRVLFGIGFNKVARWNWRETEHFSVDDFSQAYHPHMQKDTGEIVSLNLAAFKKGVSS